MSNTVSFHSSQIARLVPPAPSSPKSTSITINLDSLQEYCGIKPDDVFIDDWSKDQSLAPVSVDQLLTVPFSSLASQPLDRKAPLSYTFRAAVKFIVELINNNAKDEKPRESIVCSAGHGSEPYFTLYCGVTNISTPRPDLVPTPPQYSSSWCSVPPDGNKHLIGVVLRMLLDTGHISAYGKKGADYWVNL